MTGKQPGTKLPPERELAQVLKVSRVSLREAMHELEAKRVIERRPGRGTIVLEVPSHAQALYDTLSDSAAMGWPARPSSQTWVLRRGTSRVGSSRRCSRR